MHKDSGEEYLDMLDLIADEDVEGLKKAQKSYGNSWKQRGGVGAFMMLARKWDRLENRLKKEPVFLHSNEEMLANRDLPPQTKGHPYDIFAHVLADQRAEGVIDDIRDLRRYLLLVEAELRAGGFDATHRDNRSDA